MATSTSNYAAYSTDTDFIGWYIAATPQPILCVDGGTWTTSGSLGDCSSTSGDTIATSCYHGSSVVRGSTTEACGSGSTCDFFRIFSTTGQDGLEAKTRYACMDNWAANSVYRTLPSQWLVTSTSASATSTSSFTTSSSSISTTSTSTSTSTSSPDSSSSSSSGISNGAIAGIVVGCVAGGAILALLIVFHKRLLACFGYQKQTDSGPAWSPVYVPPQTQSASQSQPMSELSGQRNIHELGANGSSQA
ncbi:uncharacterized protein N7529_003727 [Penicillium soppii]|uniref:uncharacterized protein n=1 Tax=Penicillium soppii TaxID=69789 RepID=UPI0025475A80|nr:uncharacterized protein N7529_003727 [Penicillium soppii]KAJ5871374.1 hypothetical protein N7529_003727 [Penicillium soppii]